MKWYQYKQWSGVAHRGLTPVLTTDFGDPSLPLHMDRAVFITSKLEAPFWGTVQGYDGAAMSGGLLHNVAVLPKTVEQGDFFRLLRRVLDHVGARGVEPAYARAADLKSALAQCGWTIARDGVLRDVAGRQVAGQAIREVFTPPGGRVPRQGPQFNQACDWAMRFSALLSSEEARRPQIDYAASWMSAGRKQLEMEVYQRSVPGIDSPLGLLSAALPEPIDFAMCVYHAFSVNAPAPAAECLTAALPQADPSKFAAGLIRRLGKKKYGRWQDEPGDGGNRYDKTRKAVSASGLWSPALVRALMPVDLA